MEKKQVHRVSGPVLRAILDGTGHRYAEFCRHLKRAKAGGWEGAASWTSLQTLMAEKWVAPRYVEQLKVFVGEAVFYRQVKKIESDPKYRNELEVI